MYDPEPSTETERLQAAHAAALKAAAQVAAEPTSLVEYRSRGSVLVIGPLTQALEAAAGLAQQPVVVLSTPEADNAAATPGATYSRPNLNIVHGRPASLEGHLGQFRAYAEAPSADGPADEQPPPLDLGPLSPNKDGLYDLVLDLGAQPVVNRELPPPGYFPTRGDPQRLAEALEQLPSLVGELEKPRFFRYDPSLCAHSRRGLQACRRCIDACPAEAIVSIGEQVEVDPYLCQGGGGCATVCPSGAMTYAYPSPADSRARLRAMLHSFREAGGSDACLCIYAAEAGAERWTATARQLGPRALPLAVEELASTGMDLWLSAIAYGAHRVLLLLDEATPPRSETALREQLEIARAILSGMGHGADRLLLLQPEDPVPDTPAAAGSAAPEPARFAAVDDKRATLFMALDRLYASAPQPRPFVDLPAGAPFGTAQVDSRACTLCMACVAVCPGNALRDGGEQPRLTFVEANCLQCGMCTRACPEDAIWISPRLLYERETRRRARLLKEEEPFACIRCGKPFSTKSMVLRMTQRLQGHYMFQGEAIKRLQMCEDCRVRAMLENDEGETWFSMGRGSEAGPPSAGGRESTGGSGSIQ
jgi:ferredoxin